MTEIRLSGSGGQGLILAGIILAQAAVIDKKRVTQTQSYGPESRGGASRADVIINDSEIYFPEATHFDVLLALTQEAYDKYINDLKNEGVLIADSTFVKNISVISSTTHEVNFTEVAMQELGSPLPTNIVSLAFLVRLTGLVTKESLETAIRANVKPAFADLNIKAMEIGFRLADEEMEGEE
jgi:2-oxoglutarate ferredoxin oxidoreductase subunit gamma